MAIQLSNWPPTPDDGPVPLQLRPHQIDPTKGGCLICGIDSGSIERSLPLCTGPLTYKTNVNVGLYNPILNGAITSDKIASLDKPSQLGDGTLGGLVAGPLQVPQPPKPIEWHPDMKSHELKSVSSLMAERAKLDAEIAKRLPDQPPEPKNVKKLPQLPPRTVE